MQVTRQLCQTSPVAEGNHCSCNSEATWEAGARLGSVGVNFKGAVRPYDDASPPPQSDEPLQGFEPRVGAAMGNNYLLWPDHDRWKRRLVCELTAR
jgi:hypothetical protein